MYSSMAEKTSLFFCFFRSLLSYLHMGKMVLVAQNEGVLSPRFQLSINRFKQVQPLCRRKWGKSLEGCLMVFGVLGKS